MSHNRCGEADPKFSVLLAALLFAVAPSGAASAQTAGRPDLPRDNIVQAQVGSIDVHGPYRLTAEELVREPPSKRPRLTTEDEPSPEIMRCGDCGVGGLGEPAAPAQTPRPTSTWLAASSLGGLDPQIAAGKVYLVVTTGTQIAFYDKAGKLLTDANGTPVTPLSVGKFFKDLVPDMNSFLNLPAGADPATYQLKRFYDARTIYDSFRHRFFIVALASNSVSTGPPDNKGNPTPTKIDRAARRTKMMAAVSVDDDPRHGWVLSWWNAVIDDGVCNDPNVKTCAGTYNQPGDAGDYPCVGISERFFMASNHVGWYDPQQPANSNQERYAVVHVLPADSLAGLAPPAPNWAYWDIRFPDQSSVVQFSLQPAVHHGVDPLGFSFLADSTLSNGSTNTLVVLGFSHLEAPFAPPLRAVGVPVQPFQPAVNAPQKDGSLVGDSTGDATLVLKNIVFFTLKAAFRDNKLYVTWPDCRDWTASKSCQSANRLVRLDTSQFAFNHIPTDAGSGFIDRTFGWRNPIEDPPSELAYYGLPVVEVNKNGDMAIVYVRSSPDLYPEVRYSVYYGNDVDVLPSRLLQAGEGPLGKKNQTDTGGASVDPFDDTAVWIAHSYASGSTAPASQRLVVGKVFGAVRPDLFVKRVTVKRGAIEGDTELEVDVTIGNQGDGAAPAHRVTLVLRESGDRAPMPFGSMMLPAVPAGDSEIVTFRGELPVSRVPTTFTAEATVDPENEIEEYSEANNTGVGDRLVHVAGRARP